MPRNHTIVSTTQPVAVEAFLATDENEDGVCLGQRLEFEIGGHTITSRTLNGLLDIGTAQELLEAPVILHLMAIEDDDYTLRGYLFVVFPSSDGSTWIPDPLFTSSEAAENSPACFLLGEVSLEGTIREESDFLGDCKALLSAVSGSSVVCATERAIEDLLGSLNATA